MWCKKWASSKNEKPKDNGRLYDALIEQIKDKTDGITVKTVMYIWMQGESDAKGERVDVYARSFQVLIQQLEMDLGPKDINAIIGRISGCGIKRRPSDDWRALRNLQM